MQVEVGSKAGGLRQMLLELLEHPQDIRRIVIMGRVCNVDHDHGTMDCKLPQDKLDSEGICSLDGVRPLSWCYTKLDFILLSA